MVYGGVFGRRSPRLAAQYMAATPSTASTLEVFGAKPPAPVAQPSPVDQYDPLSIGQSRPVHRGAFGRIGRGIADALGGAPFVRADGSVRQPNFLENMMYGRPALTEMMQAEQTMANAPFQRQRLKQQVAAGDAELNDADRVSAARKRIAQGLPPQDRDVFDFDPGGYIDSHRATDNWEIDDYGRPYAIRDGQVVYGQGRVGMRQSGGGSPPSGYRFAQNGNLEAIPGGPADTRATAEGQSRLAQMDSSERSLANAENAIADANRILNQPDGLGGLNVFNDATGLTGSAMRGVPGSRAFDLNQALEPVRAILSFETLAEMRRNSSTGGALGSIAVRELELLGNTVRSLDTGQSRQQLEANLRTVGAQLRRTRAAIAAARAEAGGQSQPPIREAVPVTPAREIAIDRHGRRVSQ